MRPPPAPDRSSVGGPGVRPEVSALVPAAAATRYEDLPGPVRHRLRELVLDTLAVTSWGSRRAELRRLEAFAGPPVTSAAGGDPADAQALHGATVFGTPHRYPTSAAAALNGAAAAADQLQDGHRTARGHPGAHVVLAVFALAEELDASTAEMLSAVLAGYEVGARLGRAMDGTPPGVHDIGTWGAVAAAVGCAHLLGSGDTSALVRALELAASAPLLTDATTIFTGHDGGHAYLGASVAHGIWLGRAAAAGLAAAPGSLERLFAPIAAGSWKGLGHLHEADAHFELMRGYLKLHATCAHLHGALDAVHDLLGRLPVAPQPDEIESVRVRTYAAAAAFDSPARTELQARFSLPTALALVLLRRSSLDGSPLDDAEVASPAVQALAQRIEVEHDAALDAGYPEGRPTTVELRLRGGRTLSASSHRPRGDEDDGASRAQVRAKAERLLDQAFGTGSPSLRTVLDGWPASVSPRDLGSAFRGAATIRDGDRR